MKMEIAFSPEQFLLDMSFGDSIGCQRSAAFVASSRAAETQPFTAISSEQVIIETTGDGWRRPVTGQAAQEERPQPAASTPPNSNIESFNDGHLNDNERAEVLIIDD